jgi:hypothetical protein
VKRREEEKRGGTGRGESWKEEVEVEKAEEVEEMVVERYIR